MTEEKRKELQAVADAILNSDFCRDVLRRAFVLRVLHGFDPNDDTTWFIEQAFEEVRAEKEAAKISG